MTNIYRQQQRERIIAVMLELHRLWARTYLDETEFGSSGDDLALCAAIFAGQVSGRPLTPSKLAIVAGIPRATVIRKLATLQQRGVVTRDGGNTYTLSSASLDNPQARKTTDEVVRLLVALGRQLSEMNSDLVASASKS